MGAKIYIITGSHGQYSERTDWNICATFDLERAQSLVDKMQRLSDFNAEFDKRVYDEFEVPYREAHETELRAPHNDRPDPVPEFRTAMERCAHGKGTPEDKATLRKLQKEHIERCEEYKVEYRVRYDVWAAANKVMSDAKQEWSKQNYHPPFELEEVIKHCNDASGVRYDYDEVEIL